MQDTMHTAIENILSRHTNGSEQVIRTSAVGGGCINDTFRAETTSGTWFVKVNNDNLPGMFDAEICGLEELRKHSTFTIPRVVDTETTADNRQVFLMEFIESCPEQAGYWETFGRQLARMHRQSYAHFGWSHNNYIGSLPQSNRKHETWPEFFIAERIQPQAKLAREKGILNAAQIQSIEKCYSRFVSMFPEEPPALLHGDLWGGNAMVGNNGEPCLIDPAVYYGHREMDLAFSGLFGGFPEAFYNAYQREYPLEGGFELRKSACNLYPALVHVNLFGRTYISMVENFVRNLQT